MAAPTNVRKIDINNIAHGSESPKKTSITLHDTGQARMALELQSVLNPSPQRIEGPGLLHELIRPSSDLIALEHFENGSISSFTYADLHSAADAIAREVLKAKPEGQAPFIVPILHAQSPALYAALLGILKAGGAFCPLNLDVPAERLDFILKDVSATVVLVSPDLLDKFSFPDHIRTISIEALETISIPSSAQIQSDVLPTDLAYVMYTSGSTGVPKGVAISHDAATQALMAHESHVPDFSRFFQFAAPTFDVSVFEIFFPLARGKTLVSANRAEALEHLASVLNKMEVDACELTPTVASSLLRNRGSVPKLRTLLTIGEMLSRPVIQEFGGHADKSSLLWAMYGPTEATIHCTVMPAFQSDSPVGIIGAPLQTVSCFILDPEHPTTAGNDLNVLPRGQVGELVLGGFQLADGYLNRPEQTTKAFLETSSGRVYRTGDKARLNENGLLECFGRLSDGQVKLRGQRIELGEIEQAMLRTPDCLVATALVVNSMLVGFCAAKASVSQDDILNSCQRWLPGYMVPSEVIILGDLPKLASGKVDRGALRLLLSNRDEVENTSASSSRQEASHEGKVVRAIQECLDIWDLPSTVLVSLGVDSLRAIKLAAILRGFGLTVGVADILRARTVSDLSMCVTDSHTAPNHHQTASVSLMPYLDAIARMNPALGSMKLDIVEIMPCTSLQSAMLTASYHDSAAYHNEMTIEVDEDISVDILASGIKAICNQNEILRTGFVEWQGRPVAILFRMHAEGIIHVVSQPCDASSFKRPLTWLNPLQIILAPPSLGQRTSISISAHHAIYDGWSLDAMLRDLWTFVKVHSIPPRPQFHLVAQYQLRISQEDQEQDKRFWADHFSHWERKPFPVLIEEPAVGITRQAVTHHFELGGAAIREALQRTGCGQSSIFMAALCLVWKGIVGSDDFVIGTTTSGRALPVAHIHEIIGPCISVLPLRFRFQHIETSDQLVKYVDRMLTSLIEHSALPLAEIRKVAGLQAFEGLYDVLFTFQESIHSHAVRNGPFRQVKHIDMLETKLLIEVEPVASGFLLQATYHTDAISTSLASQMLQQLEASLIHVILTADHSLPVAFAFDSIPPSIDHYPAQKSLGVPDLAAAFEEVVEQDGRSPALEFMSTTEHGNSSEVLTYHDLNSRANQLARWLQSRGARPGMVIGIMMEKSILMYISILAIVKAGGAYLPLLPTTPSLRVKEVMDQASVSLCLVDRLDDSATKETRGLNWLLPSLRVTEAFSTTNLCTMPDETRLAYVIFTSGTTGVPKGVSVTQRNISSNIQHLRSVYPSSRVPQSRLLQACSQAFDVSVFEIFFSWLAGMCLCSGTHDTLFADIEQAIRVLRITHLSLTPTVATMIDPEHVSSVQFLVTAGEPLTRTVLNKWGSRLWQGYGPSETTNICTVKRMDKKFNIEHLGHTFPNTSVFVLQPRGQSVLPLGWVGELCFGGQQIAHGYIGDKALTAAKFVNHRRYGRLYRSGDLGRMLSDGSIVILGRIDTQIKLRGQRIDTAEIDHVFSLHRGLHSAATLLLKPGKLASSPCLVSFVTFTKSTQTRDLKALHVENEIHRSLYTTLMSRLPLYMIPTYLIPISRIPQTSSGKCNNQSLEELFHHLPEDYLHLCTQSQQDRGEDAEWQSDEKAIRETVSRTLGVNESELGRWTSLMGFGLDSISAIRVAKDLSLVMDKRVPISTLLSYPCITLLAQHLRDRQHIPVSDKPLLPKDVVEYVTKRFQGHTHSVVKVLPCTPLQEGMLSQGRGSYYNRVLLRLRSSPDVMRQCWTAVCHRHEILRTCFMTTNDRKVPVVQVVLQEWTIPWHSYSMSDLSMVSVVEKHMASLPEPIDSGIPPLSLALITYRGSYFLSFFCHHALYDGTAIGVLWREIETLAREDSLEPPVPYEPFLQIMKQRPGDWISFWGKQLRDRKSRLVLPSASHTSNAQQTIYSTKLEHRLDEIQQGLRSLQVGLLSLCQAGWATALSNLTASQDITFGNVVSGRNVDVPGLERLVAPCFNTVPIRQVLDSDLQNLQLLQGLQDLNQKILPYQFTPLREISNSVRSSRLFDTLLLVQQPLAEMDESIWTLEEDVGDMDVPLVCEVTPCPNLNSVAVKMYYDMSILTVDEVTAVSNDFTQAISRLLKSPLAAVHLETPSDLKQRPEIVDSRFRDDEPGHSALDSHWSPLELLVRQCLTSLTEAVTSEVSRTTSIFRLGIDSITAIQLASLLKDRGYPVSPADVMENPNCEKLALRMLQSSRMLAQHIKQYDFNGFRNSVSHQISRLVPTDLQIEDVLPCTPLQCAMAKLSNADNDKYLNVVGFRMDSGHEPSQIIAAWEAVRCKHHMLRTALVPVDCMRTPFAMIRYSASCSEVAWEETAAGSNADTLGPELKARIGKELFKTPHRPPWKVVMNNSAGLQYMYLVIHHALYDAVSLRNILSDLSNALTGQHVFATPNPIEGLSEILAEDTEFNAKAEQFWKNLAPGLVINRFPVLTPLREREGQRQVTTLSSRMPFSAVLEKCKSLETTIQALLEAAWTRVLAAYTGEDSVVFGVTFSTRDTDATSKTPIPCLTTLPVIARNRSSNSELLKSMVEHDAKLAAFRKSSLSDVQRWLGQPASVVFDTLITYHGHLKEDPIQAAWSIVEDIGLVEFPVALEIQPTTGNQLSLSLSFSTAVVPTEHADYILRQFDAVMYGLLHDSTNSDDHIFEREPDLFSVVPAEMETIPSEVDCLHEFVERQSLITPEATALEFHATSQSVPQMWTYAQLNEMGDKVARLVQSLNLEGSLVAVHFDKCPEAYFAILGALKAGYAFVALDPSMPKARKEFIMRDSGACCLLVPVSSVPDFDYGVPRQHIDINDLSSLGTCHYTKPPTRLDPSNTCYCLYTSGTTGTPKGCEITHDNAVQAMMAFRHLFRGRWTTDSRWLQFAALHFDVSILEQYWTWSVGMTLVVTPRDVILDDLAGTLARLRITHLDLTPSLARLLDPKDVPSLWNGVFITGGEQLRQEILDVWGPKGVIFNAYGPTEATIGVTTYSQVPQNGRPSNIGRQFLNVGTYVLHAGTDLPVVRGAVGELCISGRLVGKGYINREEITLERFPWLSRFSERVYRTGDLVRLLSDGSFDFLGRADDQVKLRGQRLELGEIDHVIRGAIPDIEDLATIVVTQKSPDRSVLVCFLSNGKGKGHQLRPMTGDAGLGRQAKAACRSQLPSYMVPTYFLEVPYIPLSINNKAEHKTLRRVFEDLSTDELVDLTSSEAVSTSKSGQLMVDKVFQALSDFNPTHGLQLQPSSSIFDAGIDSINVILFVAALRRRGVHCSAALVLQNPIVADMAEALIAREPEAVGSKVQESRLAIKASFHRNIQTVRLVLGWQPAMIEYIAPCTPLQEGMVTSALTTCSRAAYFVSFDFHLSQNVDLEILRYAWHSLIQRHAILRTAFLRTSEGCVQVASRDASMDWAGQATASERTVRKQKWLEANKDHILRPIQFTIVHSSEKGMLLCLDIFHGIYDGTSLQILLRQVTDIYEQRPSAYEAPTFIHSMSYGPLWNFDQCKEFWMNHLEGWKSSRLVDLPAKARQETTTIVSANMSLHHATIETQLRHYRVTHQSLLLALWTSALSQIFHVIPTTGLVIGGRSLDLAGVDETVGPLFNTLPFYSGSCAGQRWKDIIAHCHHFSSSILDFQHVPLRKIQKWCSMGQHILDNLLTVQQESPQKNDKILWTMTESTAVMDYPLALEATIQVNGDVQLHLVADDQVATQDVLGQILRYIENAALTSLDDPGSSWRHDLAEDTSLASILTGPSTSPESKSSRAFVWSERAAVIRQIVATMANCHLESVGPHTTMLELGLDSIDVLRLASKLRDSDIYVSPSAIMRFQTVAALIPNTSAEVPSDDEPNGSLNLAELQKRLRACFFATDRDLSTVESFLPTTPLQEGMIVAMLDSELRQYFNHEVFQLDSEVDLQMLQTAWDHVVDSNPILRTGFAEIPDENLDMSYCQVIHAFKPLQFSHHGTSTFSETMSLCDIARDFAGQSMGWDGMFQVRFAFTGSKRYMIVSIAHALYDGWSLRLVYQDLWKAYDGRTTRRPAPEEYLSRSLNSDDSEACSFWQSFLHAASPTFLCPDVKSESNMKVVDVYQQEVVSKISMQDLVRFCKEQGVSFQVLCYACWAVALARRSGQLDVSFGAVLAGRDFEGSEELMFPTMNTVAQRCILSGTCASFLFYLEQNMRDIRPRQSFPLRKAIGTATGGRPLFDTIFMVQKSFGAQEATPQPLCKPVMGNSQTEYPICAESELTGDHLVWRIASTSSSYRAREVTQLLEELETALEHLTTSPERNMLDMHGEKVSICGFKPSLLHNLHVEPATLLDNENDNQIAWSPHALTIAKVLSAVSHVDLKDIKIWNSIYHLGLDSITVIKVSALLKQKDIMLGPRDLLQAFDIAEMALMAAGRPGPHGGVDLPAAPNAPSGVSSWIPPSSVDVSSMLTDLGLLQTDLEATLPALPMQVYMMCSWYASGGRIFFPEFRIKLPSDTQSVQISHAWKIVRDEMPLLRTFFCLTNSEDVPLIQAIVKPDSASAFNAWSDCWSETNSDGEVILVLKIHHALYDAFSLSFLLERLVSLSSDPSSAVGYCPLSTWVDYTMRPRLEENQAARRQFWTDYLGIHIPDSQAASMASAPFSMERTSYVDSHTNCQASVLRRTAAMSGISIQALFLAAFAKSTAVETYGGSHNGSIVLGVYVAYRDRADTLPPGFPTLCIIPIKVKVEPGRHLLSSAQAIQADLNTIVSRGMAEVGLWEIWRWTGITVHKIVNFIAKETGDGEGQGLQWLPARSFDEQVKSVAAPTLLGEVNMASLTPAYPATIEVEASLDEEVLTVGVFGPRALVTRQEAVDMVSKLSSTLLQGIV